MWVVGNASGRSEKVQKRYHSLYSSSLSIYITSTGGGSAAPRVAKPDGVVDGIFP